MMLIEKHPLILDSRIQVHRPGGDVSELLTVQNRNGAPCLWFSFATNISTYWQSEIRIHGVQTGDPRPDIGYRYLSTTQYDDQVWHWYGRTVYPRVAA